MPIPPKTHRDDERDPEQHRIDAEVAAEAARDAPTYLSEVDRESLRGESSGSMAHRLPGRPAIHHWG